MANAGRILIMPKGEYDASVTYTMLDLVMYNNASWLAKKTATGITPEDGEYWHKMADGVALTNNLETEAEGTALDATQGKALKELVDGANERIDVASARINELIGSITDILAEIESVRGLIDNIHANVEITQEAYDNLGDEKLTNGVAYFIRDGVAR